jgi:tRNA(fMet)-specific endonuclease VapC
MSLYVLDTDVLTLYRKGRPTVIQNVVAHLQDDLTITVITVEEQLTGWYRVIRQTKKPDELARVYQEMAVAVMALATWSVLSLTEPAIQRYEQLKALKLNIAKMDLRIAAITLEHGGILVTRNLRDFQQVPGLTLENWTV